MKLSDQDKRTAELGAKALDNLANWLTASGQLARAGEALMGLQSLRWAWTLLERAPEPPSPKPEKPAKPDRRK